MKKIKLFLCVALFGAVSFGAFSAYDHYTMSADERALLENVEALTSGETPGGGGFTLVTFCSWNSGMYQCRNRTQKRAWVRELAMNISPSDNLDCPSCPDNYYEAIY